MSACSVFVLSLLAALAIVGCGPGSGTVCQSGAKYGTQCYSTTDVATPPGQRPDPPFEPPGEKK